VALILTDMMKGAQDTLLSAHTPEFGGPWSIEAGDPALDGTDMGQSTPFLFSGGLYYEAPPGYTGAVATVAMASADQVISAQIRRWSSTPGDGRVGVVARLQDAANYYCLDYRIFDDLWHLCKRVAGALSDLATYNIPLADGLAIPVALQVDGTDVTAIIGGEEQTPVSDADLGAAGSAGILILGQPGNDATNGMHVEEVVIQTL
jgi:hypothetical protein